MGLPRHADVADLGAGTGKLTRVLLGQFDRVIAIEALDYQAAKWREAFEGSAFEPLEHRVFPHEEDVSADALVARIGSWSNFTTMPTGRREQVLADIRSHLTEPSYRVRLNAEAWTTRRLA